MYSPIGVLLFPSYALIVYFEDSQILDPEQLLKGSQGLLGFQLHRALDRLADANPKCFGLPGRTHA